MKPNLLLTGMLGVVTIAISSCYTPRMAQQVDTNDDVYNTTAKAQEYVQPVPVQTYDNGGYADNGNYNDNGDYDNGNYDNGNYDDGYGTSDPYSDMDYSSRINRFSYGSSYIPYFDPYYGGFGYNSFYPYSSGFSFGLGLGFGWGSPYYGGLYSGWGYGGLYSPFWGFNNYYGGAYGGFYGGGYGGYYGGYYGGGYYSRIRNNPRPTTRIENGRGYRPSTGYSGRPGATRTVNGVVMDNTRRGDRGTNTINRTNPNDNTARPTRTERYTPPQRTESRPTYTPPANYGGGRSMGGSFGGGSMGGGGRSSRGGRN